MTTPHKTFVSYYHDDDQGYKEKFESLCENVVVSKSVNDGDMDSGLQIENVRQLIRDNYLRDSTVTVVLVGKRTWQKKHVDWEIGSSIRNSRNNPRSGLIGIILPTYPGYYKNEYDLHTIPPRLYYNLKCEYAEIYRWTTNRNTIKTRIHNAFNRRKRIDPDNSYTNFARDRSGERWYY